MAEDFHNTAMRGIGCLKKLAGGGVCKLNDSLCIGNEYAIGHLFKDGSEAGAFSVKC